MNINKVCNKLADSLSACVGPVLQCRRNKTKRNGTERTPKRKFTIKTQSLVGYGTMAEFGEL